METTKNILIYLFIFTIYNFEILLGCAHDIIRFTQKTLSGVILKEEFANILLYNREEERQKLCFYAKLAVGLLYINPNYIPDWREFESDSSSIHPFHGAMYCATLPTIYLFKKSHESSIQITFIRSMVDNFKFKSEIAEADSISLIRATHGDNKKEEFNENHFSKLTMEDRRNLCVAAGELRRCKFLDNNVAEAQPYKFKYSSNEEETDVAIGCPTFPELYLRKRGTEPELQIVVLRNPLDDYEFEVERREAASVVPLLDSESCSVQLNDLLNVENRMKLCTLAREYYVWLPIVFVQDIETPEARLYSFQYGPKEQSTNDVAILCPALPSLYLRLNTTTHYADNSTRKKKIEITFVQTPAHNYTYNVQILDYLYSKRAGKITDLHKLKLKEHQLVRRGGEFCQNTCFAAQKFLLNSEKNCWNFRFANKESIFFKHQLLIIPKYISSPKLYVLEHLDGIKEKDVVVVQCSVWPQMYVRLGQTDNEITILLLQFELL